MATPSSTVAWIIPWTEEPGSTVHGVTKGQTRLSDQCFSLFSTLTPPLINMSVFCCGVIGILYIFWKLTLYQIMWFTSVFSLSAACLSTLLIISFACRSFSVRCDLTCLILLLLLVSLSHAHEFIVKVNVMKIFPYIFLRVESEVTQSCLTLCDPMDCSPPGSSVHGILQARPLEQVAISSSKGNSYGLMSYI